MKDWRPRAGPAERSAGIEGMNQWQVLQSACAGPSSGPLSGRNLSPSSTLQSRWVGQTAAMHRMKAAKHCCLTGIEGGRILCMLPSKMAHVLPMQGGPIASIRYTLVSFWQCELGFHHLPGAMSSMTLALKMGAVLRHLQKPADGKPCKQQADSKSPIHPSCRHDAPSILMPSHTG